MDFFDKLSKQASKTYQYTSKKTSKIAKEAKLKMAMNEHKSEIEELYEEIGKKVYMNHVNSRDIDIDIEAVVEEYCIQIDELCDRIEDERKELLDLKDRKQCPNCFYEIEKEFHYCPNCGIEQLEEEDFERQSSKGEVKIDSEEVEIQQENRIEEEE